MYGDLFYILCPLKLLANARQMARMGGKVDDLLFVSIDEEEDYEKSVTVRSDFRETWIFEDFFIGYDEHF